MTDKELMFLVIKDVEDSFGLIKGEEFPLDSSGIVGYNPDSWMSVMFKNIANKLIMIVELQGDGLPIISCEMNADPTLVADVLSVISAAFGKFKTTNPCYHRGTGMILCGKEAAIQYSNDRLAEMDSRFFGKIGSKPPSGMYN